MFRKENNYVRIQRVLDEFKRLKNMTEPVLVVDMDGVLADFDDRTPGWYGNHLLPGHYLKLNPYKGGLDFVRKVANIISWDNVFICTCSPCVYADHDKMVWLVRNLPEIYSDNIVVLPVNSNKAEYMRDFLTMRGFDPQVAILLDDYGKNLNEWYTAYVNGDHHAVAFPAIKAHNPYNCRWDNKKNKNVSWPVIDV